MEIFIDFDGRVYLRPVDAMTSGFADRQAKQTTELILSMLGYSEEGRLQTRVKDTHVEMVVVPDYRPWFPHDGAMRVVPG